MNKITLMAATALLASTAMVGSALAQEESPMPPGPGGGCMMMDGGYDGAMGGGPGKDGPRGKHRPGMMHGGMHGGPGGMHGDPGGMHGQLSLNTPVTPARVKAVLEGQIARWGEALTVGNVTEKDKVVSAEILGRDGKVERTVFVSTETGRFFQMMTPERLHDIVAGWIAMHGGTWKVGAGKQDGSKVLVEVFNADGAVHHVVVFDNATGKFDRQVLKK